MKPCHTTHPIPPHTGHGVVWEGGVPSSPSSPEGKILVSWHGSLEEHLSSTVPSETPQCYRRGNVTTSYPIPPHTNTISHCIHGHSIAHYTVSMDTLYHTTLYPWTLYSTLHCIHGHSIAHYTASMDTLYHTTLYPWTLYTTLHCIHGHSIAHYTVSIGSTLHCIHGHSIRLS